MTSDRTRRVRRCYLWGFGAVLAAAAGAASAQQSNSSTDTYQPNKDDQQSTSSSQVDRSNSNSWRQADTIQQLRNKGVVVLYKEDNNKSTEVTIQDGRVVGAEIDGQFTSPDNVQVQGNRIRVLDNNNQVAATFRVPNLSNLPQSAFNTGRSGSTYGSNEAPYNQQYGQQYDRNQGGYNQQYGQGYNDQYNPGYDRNYNNWQSRDQGMYNRGYSSGYDRNSNDWQNQGRYDQGYQRGYNPGQYNQGYPGQYSQGGYYGQGNYQPDYNRNYDRYNNDRGYSQNDDRQGMYNQGRTYGSNEMGRTPMPLGIMTSDATQSDLSNTSAGGRYTQGIRIEQVQDGMPASTAGLQKGDIIVSIDGQQPATSSLLRQELLQKDQGDTLRLTVLRNGSEQNVNVKVQNVDRSKYNWDYMNNPNATGQPTVDHGVNTLPDQKMLQPNNRQEIYQPSQEGSGNNGRPLWDRTRDQITGRNNNSNPR